MSPHRQLFVLSEKYPDVFGIFLFLAKMDNRFMAREKEAIARFAREQTGCDDIGEEDISQLFDGRKTPNIKGFRLMLANVAVSGMLPTMVQTCSDILGDQAEKNPMAKILMDEIQSKVHCGIEGSL